LPAENLIYDARRVGAGQVGCGSIPMDEGSDQEQALSFG
jgi:hypothetical protein